MKVWVYNHRGIRFRIAPVAMRVDKIINEDKEGRECWLVYHEEVEMCKWLTDRVSFDTAGYIEL